MAQVQQRAYTLHYVANLVGCKLKVDAAVAPALAFGARGPSQARLRINCALTPVMLAAHSNVHSFTESSG